MWTKAEPTEARVYPRPARIAYLIPEDASHTLISALIDECLSRWGGRRTPIIPTNGKNIADTDWQFLDAWDADIIYSYSSLEISLEKRIYYSFAPSEIIIHEHLEAPQDAHSLRPEYCTNLELLSSLSLLPYFAKRSQAGGMDLPEILDKEPSADVARDALDSFGFVSTSYNDFSLLPYAQRLSIRRATSERVAPRFRNATEISYYDASERVFELVAEQRSLLTLALLSDSFCPHLNDYTTGHNGWDDHLTIVIGDEVADRLLFWNAQHRYRSLTTWGDMPVLMLSNARLANGTPDWLKFWVTRRNRRHFPGNNSPRTVIRSCSLSKAQLEEIARSVGQHSGAFVSPCFHERPSVFDLTPKPLRSLGWKHSGRWVDQTGIVQGATKFQNKEFELPLVLPRHIRDNLASTLTGGCWAATLVIERSEDHSTSERTPDVWVWPRRFRLERSVDVKNYGPGQSSALPKRPARDGDLVLWESNSWPRPLTCSPKLPPADS